MDASAAQAFGMLSNSVMSSQSRTLENLAQDMLRPKQATNCASFRKMEKYFFELQKILFLHKESK
ncbi:DUF2497 domain-containing protein [Methylobacterium sp. Leaf91]|uniref:DUF2497 domain-containing protein n=1 Tax=Methylobacterium sp. Leaf91 TaxID=1736247 RepID=UPI000AAEBE3D|nr:DUF2497 domain-containing protein [Methylobacterium sp. Leaf91]